MADHNLRLDKFLWFARLTKTRSAAQASVAAGHFRIDGRAVDRAHVPVRIGNVVVFPQADRVRAIRVVALPGRRGPASEAQTCYVDLIDRQTCENASQAAADIDVPVCPT